MTSFLDKLKVKIEENEAEKEAKDEKQENKSTGFLQLDVDIYQTSSDIIIVAPVPGVELSELDVNIENENDVVTIQGKVEVPDFSSERNGKYLRQECQWGQFYRQIILPQEVNVSEVEAKFKKGILTLRLPLLRLQTSGRKKISVDN